MGKSNSAPAPDPMVGYAAEQSANTGQQWLDFTKQAYGDSQARQVGIDALNAKVTTSQLDNQQTAQGWAQQAHDRQVNTFQPLQDQFIQKAQNWDSAGAQSNAASAAAADVTNSFTQQDAQRTRSMSAMGVNPASGRFDGVERASDSQAALAGAGAENNARTTLKNQAMALQGSAINMGNGLAANASSDLGLSNSSGQMGAATSMAGGQMANSAASIMNSGFQGAMSGYGQMGSLANTSYQEQMQQYNANNAQSSGLMGGLGSLAGMFIKTTPLLTVSDKDAKEDKKEVRGVLDALKKMPVESWKYKKSANVDDGQQHIGTYAQDFQKATGLGDGKTINVVDALGVTMGAIKELAEKVEGMKGKGDGDERVTSATKPQPKSRSIMRKAA